MSTSIIEAKLRANGFKIYITDDKIRLVNDSVTICGVPQNTAVTTSGVFCDHCYAFASNDEFVAFDIGMNIGVSSLYFAGYENIKHIYGFEPFAPTFATALDNLAGNPRLAPKITPHNFGLGSRNEWLEVHYKKDSPGSMSTAFDRFESESAVERVEIRDAAETLGPMFAAHDCKILLKIDCEGAEKDVLSSLAHGGALGRVDVIVMEWHFTPPAYLVNLLKKKRLSGLLRPRYPQ